MTTFNTSFDTGFEAVERDKVYNRVENTTA